MKTADYVIADALMAAYLEHNRRKVEGETTGVRAIAWSLSGVTSACCGAPPTLTKKLVEVCFECRRQCQWKVWSAPREHHAQGDGYRTMVLRETRSRRNDVEEVFRLREALRGTRVAKLIEHHPRAMSAACWSERLYVWGVYLLTGSLRAAHERIGAEGYTEKQIRDRREAARGIVAARARRAPYDVRAALDGVRLDGGRSGTRLCA